MELESQIDSINQINEKKGVDFKIISPRVTGYLSVCIKNYKTHFLYCMENFFTNITIA